MPHPQCGAHYTTRTMHRRRVDTTRAAQRRKFERRRRAAPDKSENSCNHSLEFETIKIRRDCTRPPVVTFDVLSSFSLAFQTKRRAGAEIPISAPLGEYVWPRNEMTIDRERRGGRGGSAGEIGWLERLLPFFLERFQFASAIHVLAVYTRHSAAPSPRAPAAMKGMQGEKNAKPFKCARVRLSSKSLVPSRIETWGRTVHTELRAQPATNLTCAGNQSKYSGLTSLPVRLPLSHRHYPRGFVWLKPNRRAHTMDARRCASHTHARICLLPPPYAGVPTRHLAP